MDKDDSLGAAPTAGFAAEFQQCWAQMPNKGLFVTLLAAWLVLFHFLGNSNFGYVDTTSTMYWLLNVYAHSLGDEEHGYLIPPAILVLFWFKRRELLALPKRVWPPGLLLVAGALLMHIVGYMVQQERLSVLALFGGIYALTGLAWGPGWMRASFFPMFLLAFCVPLSTIAEPVTFPLRLLVTKIVEVLGVGMGFEVSRDGTRLFSPDHYNFEVAAACSGMRSLMAVLGIATVYAFLSFEAAWKRLLMMASALPLAVLGNVVRMMVIIVSAEFFGQAGGNFAHENWLISLVPYGPAFGGVFLLGHWLREKRREPAVALEVKTA